MLESASVNSYGFFRNLGRVRSALVDIKSSIENKSHLHQQLKHQQQQQHQLIQEQQHQQHQLLKTQQQLQHQLQISQENQALIEAKITPPQQPIIEPIPTTPKSTQTDPIPEPIIIQQPSPALPPPPTPAAPPTAPNSSALTVLERLEIRFLKETIQTACSDNAILYTNFTDSLRVIEALKKKLTQQNLVISSTHDQLRVDHQILRHSHAKLLEQLKNTDLLVELWKNRFETLRTTVIASIEEEQQEPKETSKQLARLTAENANLRKLLNINITDDSFKKLEQQVEESENNFYNSLSSEANADLESKQSATTSHIQRPLNKDSRKITHLDKSHHVLCKSVISKDNIFTYQIIICLSFHHLETISNSDKQNQQNEVTGNPSLRPQPPSTAPNSQTQTQQFHKFQKPQLTATSASLNDDPVVPESKEFQEAELVKQAQLRLLDGGDQNEFIDFQDYEENEQDQSPQDIPFSTSSQSKPQYTTLSSDSHYEETQSTQQPSSTSNHHSTEEIDIDDLPDHDNEVDEGNEEDILGQSQNQKQQQFSPNDREQSQERDQEVEEGEDNGEEQDHEQEQEEGEEEEEEVEEEGEDEEGEGQDEEEEEEGEYYENQIDFNDYYGYANKNKKVPEQQQPQPKQTFDFSDRARAKEFLLQQSKQFTEQMSNQKFFKQSSNTK